MCIEKIKPVEPIHNNLKSKNKYYFDNDKVYEEEDNEPVSELENMPQNILYDFLGRYK